MDGWLSFGRVPALVLMVLSLASFALTGFALKGLLLTSLALVGIEGGPKPLLLRRR